MVSVAPMHSASRRRRASLAAFLYALLSLALPGLHLCFHHDDHDHDGGGLHHHDGGLGLADDDDDDDHDGDHDAPGHHGGGSMAHFASALLPVLSALPPCPPAALGFCAPLPGRAQLSSQEVASRLRARAPPSRA